MSCLKSSCFSTTILVFFLGDLNFDYCIRLSLKCPTLILCNMSNSIFYFTESEVLSVMSKSDFM